MSLRASSIPTLSVGIPTFNQAKYLRATLDSLLDQTRIPLELVVSNNHSTDDTAQILSEYGNKITCIRPPQHLEMMEHWNFLVSNLSGDWFTLLSSDDLAKKKYIEVLTDAIDANYDAVLVRCAWENIDLEGHTIDRRYLLSTRKLTLPPQTFYEQLSGPKGSFAAFAASKSAWKQVGGFSNKLTIAGDWGFWLKLSQLGSFVTVKRVISQYRSDYRPDLTRKRITPWIKDEIVIATEIIPEVAESLGKIDLTRINDCRIKRFNQCLADAGVLMDPCEKLQITKLFEGWATQIGVNLEESIEWKLYLVGERKLNGGRYKAFKALVNKLAGWIGLLLGR